MLVWYSAGENFRVYVVLPLLPAFEGEIGTNTGTAIQAVIHWNYTSICRGGKSLLERLFLAGGLSSDRVLDFEERSLLSDNTQLKISRKLQWVGQ